MKRNNHAPQKNRPRKKPDANRRAALKEHRLIASAMRKIAQAHEQRIRGFHYLTPLEYGAALRVVRAAVLHSRYRKRMPKSFIFQGKRYPLAFLWPMDRVCVCCPRTGERLLASGYFAI